MTQLDLAGHAILRDGRPVTVRPLLPADVEPLAAFFASLSEDTRRRYAPHPFDRATAELLCSSIDSDPRTRFIVVLEDEPGTPVAGYLIFNPNLSKDDQERYAGHVKTGLSAAIAPVVADAYQRQGVGSLLMRHVIACARDMGMLQIVLSGGVRAFNEKAICYYEKLGFTKTGEFWTRDPDLTLNYAMVLDI